MKYSYHNGFLSSSAPCGNRGLRNCKSGLVILIVCIIVTINTGCKSPADYRRQADDVAYYIIRQKQHVALGETEDFSIEKPSDLLRRRLLLEQDLLYLDEASLGSGRLEQIEHWPDADYSDSTLSADEVVGLGADVPLKLSLIHALQVGARNSFTYQTRKEQIFQKALALDLERNDFRNIFSQQVESLVSTDASEGATVSGVRQSSTTGWAKTLENGISLSANLAIDLANLLTLGGASSLGLRADATVTVPLLRGSGEHIVTEGLTQAERNVVYEIYGFERFKRQFAVDTASAYFSVLEDSDQVKNEEANYRNRIKLVRRSKRLADAGQLSEIQVDQAVQNELRARNDWIGALQSYEQGLDDFKILLGLPVDARLELDPNELGILAARAEEFVSGTDDSEQADVDSRVLPADAPVEYAEVGEKNAGPFEIDRSVAEQLALDNRLDLRVARGQVFDAQRVVVVAADALRAELNLVGHTESGSRRTVDTAGSDDARIRANQAISSGVLTLNLAVERTAERNNYRNSLISLEETLRVMSTKEDEVKLDVRNRLRTLLLARESVQIQAESVRVAEKRVRSTDLFLQAGRVQIRDVLEAQDDLVSAQNSLTAAVVRYRVAELQLQRDMGMLKVNEKGLWREFDPEEINNE